MLAACNNLILSIWGEDANSPMQGLHAAWGLGFAFGPLIIRPFLGPDREDDVSSNVTTMSPTHGYNVTIMTPEVQESRIQIAYSIVALLSLVAGAVVFLFKYCVQLPNGMQLHLKPKQSMAKVFSLDTIAGGNKRYAITMLILFGLLYFSNAGREGIFVGWLFSYAVESEELDFSKQEAALLDAAAKFSYFVGRLIATFIALKVPIQPMIFTEVLVNSIILSDKFIFIFCNVIMARCHSTILTCIAHLIIITLG